MTIYSMTSPFLAPLKKKELLSKSGSTKKVVQLILDIKKSPILFSPGDSAAIFPKNDPLLVAKTLQSMHLDSRTPILHPRTRKPLSIETYLTSYATITRFSSALLTLLSSYQKETKKKEKIFLLLDPKNKPLLTEYLHSHEVWDLFEELGSKHIPPQEICSHLMPLLPRFYSITSSLKMYPDEIRIIVGLVSFTTSRQKRLGVASHYLCDLVKEGDSIPVYIQTAHGFSLPENPSSDIIMIGSGTGIAPFSAFLQERYVTKASGKNWLFFGERNRSTDFYFEPFLTRLEREKFLRLSTAFSRDQEKKIYVQHRIEEKGKAFFSWLKNGAYLYLCGDAKALVKDVEATFQKILREVGGLSQEEALLYLKNMRLEKRYRKDVY